MALSGKVTLLRFVGQDPGLWQGDAVVDRLEFVMDADQSQPSRISTCGAKTRPPIWAQARIDRRCTRFIPMLVAAVTLLGEQSALTPTTFEVASVKFAGPQSRRGSEGGPGSSDPGNYRFHSAALNDLIATAYHVKYFQIISKSPLDRDEYDLDAKLPEGTTQDQFRVMMQNLLAERFRLKMHRESRDFPAWEMTVAKSGLKIKQSSGPDAEMMSEMIDVAKDGFPVLPSGKAGYFTIYDVIDGFIVGRMVARQQPVSVLANSNFGPDAPPIVDKTSLTGKYDFRLEYARETPISSTGEARVPPYPNLRTAVEQQLGLQFTPKKHPFDVVVVDSVDRVPTEN